MTQEERVNETLKDLIDDMFNCGTFKDLEKKDSECEGYLRAVKELCILGSKEIHSLYAVEEAAYETAYQIMVRDSMMEDR